MRVVESDNRNTAPRPVISAGLLYSSAQSILLFSDTKTVVLTYNNDIQLSYY